MNGEASRSIESTTLVNFIARYRIAHVINNAWRIKMSSTPDFSERPQGSMNLGDGDLYDSSGVEEATSLTVQGEGQLDESSRQSLAALQRSANSIFDYVRRNPVRVAIGVAGVAALLAAWSRRANRY
jgi:hypothetical protein